MRIAALALVGLLIAAAVGRYAAAAHYDSCVEAAIASHPLGEAGLTAEERQEQDAWDQYRGDGGFFDEEPSGTEPEALSLERRQDAIAGCSHVPW